jgi:hypothetical protein
MASEPPPTESLSEYLGDLADPTELKTPALELNKRQRKAADRLEKFLADPSARNFMLLGPAGSGKTTTVVTGFNNSRCRVAFAAFTNKATQVLRLVSKKFNLTFKADFSTVHSLLRLEARYTGNDTGIHFKFDPTKVLSMQKYDVVIVDECSTLSAELVDYLMRARDVVEKQTERPLKYIFIGDFDQLGPVGEEISTIFKLATKNGWPISKLKRVMRAANDQIAEVNDTLLEWIGRFKNKKEKALLNSFVANYPYNLVPDSDAVEVYTDSTEDFLWKYMEAWKTNPSVVIVTYSRNNREKTNNAIQDILDGEAKRETVLDRDVLEDIFPGDRCCVDKPVVVQKVHWRGQGSERALSMFEETQSTLYNGEIFEVLETLDDIKIKTNLNKIPGVAKYFEGQLITVRRAGDESGETFQIPHIPSDQVEAAQNRIKRRLSKKIYYDTMSAFTKVYPALDYGYCITLYKTQGSEWDHVFINLNSIKWSVAGSETQGVLMKKRRALLRSTYTAVSRASTKITLFWS